MDNASLARLFDELATLLEISGESPFKTRAYRAFAETARAHPRELADPAAQGELAALPGVGKAILAKVESAAAVGTFAALDRARAAVPEEVRALLEVEGLTPRLVRTLWKDGGITSLAGLIHAAEENRIAAFGKLGAEGQARVLGAARARLEAGSGALLATAVAAAREIERLLKQAGAREVVAVGDARRGRELVRELAVLVRGLEAGRIAPALDAQEGLEGARAHAAAGGATMVIRGLPLRVRAVKDRDWVHALLAGTGDAAHVAWLEARAGGDLAAACRGAESEEAVYRALDLSPVPPELREGGDGRGRPVPEGLVALEDIAGFFHVHTDWSDGTAPILTMARAAARAGYTYLGISDHSRAATYANGLDEERLAEQAGAIAIARLEEAGCEILHGVEVDILAAGDLDLPDEALASLDFVIASIHARFGMTGEQMTARLVRAVSHPLVTILGHPTGRLLLGRSGYAFDLEAVARAAAANDTYLEINANAQRLDLDCAHVRRAARVGARFAIDPDAHADHALDDTRLGVMVARRAGLTKEQVLNARGREAMRRVLAERKAKALERLRARSG